MANPDTLPESVQLPPPLAIATARTRAKLLEAALTHSVPAGTVLFDQGELPTFQQIVVEGSVHLLGIANGREVLIDSVHSPELVIPAAAMTATPYLMRARTPEPTRLLLIHADAFRAAVASEPVLVDAVIKSLSRQFRRMVRQIKNLKLRSAEERVGCYILTLSGRQGTPERAVFPYEKNLVASELGMTRESFSRALGALKKYGIGVDGQTILINNPKRLSTFACPDPLIDGPEMSASLATETHIPGEYS